MMKILVPLMFMSPDVFAEVSFTNSVRDLQAKIAEQEVNQYIEKPQSEGVPGDFFESLLPKKQINPETVCEEENERKNPEYEVILIAEPTANLAELEVLPKEKVYLHNSELEELSKSVPYSITSRGLTLEAVTQRAGDLWNHYHFSNTEFDPHTPIGREVFIESLIYAGRASELSEGELTRNMAGMISSIYKTDKERLDALSAFSLRLYRNYNVARNPGYNNPLNNPFGVSLPEGDLSVTNLLQAAVDFNKYGGGVCNDISEAVVMVGEHLFPDKDVLAVNAGSHFGVIITDGKTTNLIDGGTQYEMSNKLLLTPKLPSSNLRISKVVEGALKEIAVVDTEMGQVMESAFQTGKKLLKTDADVSTIMAHMKKENFGVTVGTAKLSDSQVYVVVAKYEYQRDNWKSYVGLGGSAQNLNLEKEHRYQIHFRAGAERNIFRYVSSQSDLSFASGIRVAGMYAFNQMKANSSGVEILDLSGSADLYQKVDYAFGKHDPKGIQVKSSFELEHTLSSTNWGNITAALSHERDSDIGKILRNMNFHLNQINTNLTLEKEIRPGVTGIMSAHYQGSNVGQSAGILAGLNIRAPEGAQILVFTGHTNNDIRGFKTKHSLLGNPSGATVGAKYTTKSGREIGAAVRSISGEKPSVQATVKIPLSGNKK